jgi:hypothetical protein
LSGGLDIEERQAQLVRAVNDYIANLTVKGVDVRVLKTLPPIVLDVECDSAER